MPWESLNAPLLIDVRIDVTRHRQVAGLHHIAPAGRWFAVFPVVMESRTNRQ
jgi:hypothetical protein